MLRAHLRRYVRKNWLWLAMVVLIALAVMGFVSVYLLWIYGPRAPVVYVLGLFHGVMGAALVAVIREVALLARADAFNHLRGDLAETNTRDVLRSAKFRRLIWGWVDSIEVGGSDVDHVVVTRSGGVVAIDTKWRSTVTENDLLECAHAAQNCAKRARSVLRDRGILKRDTAGRRRADTSGVVVRAAIVMWGPVVHEMPDSAALHGVEVVNGRHLRRWLASQGGDRVTKLAAKDVLRALEEFRDKHAPPKKRTLARFRR